MVKAPLTAAALLTLSISQAWPVAPAHGPAAESPFASTAKTLYVNTGTDSGVGAPSQNFEASLDNYDSAAADDFTVPQGQTWILKEVDVTGHYFNGIGPADSESVTIYRGSHGKVGRVVASYPGLVGSDNDGSFSIPVPKTTLRPGVYFVSVVINMSFVEGGEWHWENMLEVHGNPPEWESPNSGGKCQTWTVETTCFGPGIGDHFFALRGTAK